MRVKNTAFILVLVGFTTLSLSGCKTNDVNVNASSTLPDAPDISYTPLNLIGHSVERILHGWREAPRIRIVNPQVYGLDDENAIVYGKFLVGEGAYGHGRHGFILKTANSGQTWVQVLGPIPNRINGEITELRFIDKKNGWLIWVWDTEGIWTTMLRTQNAGHTWQKTDFDAWPILADWAFSSPNNGIAIVVPEAHDVPVGDGSGKTTSYWITVTKDGGQRWEDKETVANEDERRYPEEDIPDNWWVESSPRWTIKEFQDSYSVQRLGNDGTWENVFTLPKTPYRNTELSR